MSQSTKPEQTYSPSYDELVGELHDLMALERRVESRMFKCEPSSHEGAEWHRRLMEVTKRRSACYRQVRNHPDAPPAG